MPRLIVIDGILRTVDRSAGKGVAYVNKLMILVSGLFRFFVSEIIAGKDVPGCWKIWSRYKPNQAGTDAIRQQIHQKCPNLISCG